MRGGPCKPATTRLLSWSDLAIKILSRSEAIASQEISDAINKNNSQSTVFANWQKLDNWNLVTWRFNIRNNKCGVIQRMKFQPTYYPWSSPSTETPCCKIKCHKIPKAELLLLLSTKKDKYGQWVHPDRRQFYRVTECDSKTRLISFSIRLISQWKQHHQVTPV